MSTSLSAPPGSLETLADVLLAGPLSLRAGLRCGGQIATELRDLHQQSRVYGKLSAASIAMSESGAHLRLLGDYPERAPERDVQAFGAIFHEMLTGTPPPATLTTGHPRIQIPSTGPVRLRSIAIRVALKCLAPQRTAPSMQQVAMEIRLLAVQLRQYEAGTGAGRPKAAAPAPFPGAVPPPRVPVEDPVVNSATLHGEIPALMAPVAGGAAVVPLGPDSFGRPAPTAAAQGQPSGGRCPKCNSAAIFVARARSRFEDLLERWRVPLCRCHQCYHRYIVVARIRISKDMPAPGKRRYKRD